SKIQISGDGSRIETAGLKYIINPYDEFAIEEALKIKEKAGGGEVVIASFATDAAKELIIKGLAMGGDRGLLITNEGLGEADSLT
ncbi:electron transfer flavoprotein subunit beta/FixA family protein, partial [Klebsiella pneumoniae]